MINSSNSSNSGSNNINNSNNIRKAKKYTIFEGTDREFTGTRNQICDKFNITLNDISHILRYHNRDYPFDQIAEKILTNRINNSTFTIHGFSGKRNEICKYFNTNYKIVYNRMADKNETFEQAIEHYIQLNIKKGLYSEDENGNIVIKDYGDTYNNKKNDIKKFNILGFEGNKKEICEHYNLNSSTISSRMRQKNETFEESCIYYINNGINKSKNTYIIRGFEGNQKQICEHFDIKYPTLVYRMKKLNMTFENAINYYLDKFYNENVKDNVFNN